MKHRATLAFLLIATLFAGCATAKKPSAPKPNDDLISNSDPLAMQLHEVSGDLLLYYAKHRHLPEKLDELLSEPGTGLDASMLVSPLSKTPYVYDLNGQMIPGSGRLILYDPTRGVAGLRWGVTITLPGNGRPGTSLVTRVIAVSDNNFRDTASP